MSNDQPPITGTPHRIGAEDVFFFDAAAVVPPLGTTPPLRPPGRERQPVSPGAAREWEFIEIGGEEAVVPPPGTLPPPRPPGQERQRHAPAERPAAPTPVEVPALVARIEEALTTIHAALAEIKRLQAAPVPLPQSKAG